MNLFSSVKIARPKRSAFNMSHEKKQSMKMGGLYPVYLEEILPGDKFKVRSEILMRFAPLISPIMHRVDVYTHYFFVPNRIVWENWKEFITGGEDGLAMPVMPRLTIEESRKQWFEKGRLPDYFGIPPVDQGETVDQNLDINVLPFRAYAEIYNEYYRDQNLEEKIPYQKGDTVTQYDHLTQIRTRAWEKDYLTSALPWAQRGGEVNIPTSTVGDTVGYRMDGDPLTAGNENLEFQKSQGEQTGFFRTGVEGGINIDTDVGITINDLRQSTRLQEWLEKNARAGSRYIEQILSHFGVRSSDARLQRPEYLGGGKSPVVVSEVLQTSQTNTDQGPAVDPSQQGNMAGHGISVGSQNGFNKSFEEHGYVIGIMSVLPRTAYQDGVHRRFRKFDKLEYGWPEFANLGEQEVKNHEVFYDPTDTTDANETFGYQSRYSEYKYGDSKVAGDFRDNLSHWHMGRQLTNAVLNSNFVKSSPRTDIFAVDDGSDHLYCQIYNSVKALRPLPYYGTPRL